MKTIYVFVTGLIVGVILTIIFFPNSKSKPVQINSTGRLSGGIKISPDLAENETVSKGLSDFSVQKTKKLSIKKPNLALGEYKVPMAGELVTDSNLGKVTTQLNGVTTVIVDQEDLKVDTQFSGVSTLKSPAEKSWRVYIGAKSDYSNVYPVIGIGYQKTFGNFYYDFSGDIWENRSYLTGEVKLAIGIKF